MFGLRMVPCCCPSEDALDHRPARLRHRYPGWRSGSLVDGAVAGLAGFGDAWFCVTCGVTPMARRLRHDRGIVRLASPAVDAATCALRLAFSMVSEAGFGGAIGMRDPAGYASPAVLHGGCPYSKVCLARRLAIEPGCQGRWYAWCSFLRSGRGLGA